MAHCVGGGRLQNKPVAEGGTRAFRKHGEVTRDNRSCPGKAWGGHGYLGPPVLWSRSPGHKIKWGSKTWNRERVGLAGDDEHVTAYAPVLAAMST